MQKIIPSLWFDTQAEEAANYYISAFGNGKILSMVNYPEAGQEITGGKPGSVMTVDFEIDGMRMLGLNGGPLFKFTPAISFFVFRETEAELDALWAKLSEGGSVMMEYGKYPFSEKYGWCADKYGVSWQLNLGKREQRIVPSFLFTKDGFGKCEEAIRYYVSVFPDSEVGEIARYEPGEPDEEGKIKYANFQLAGQAFSAMESSLQHEFTFNEAVSLIVYCKDQAEMDAMTEKLSAVPEAEQCGWVKDKYGVSWQITPEAYDRWMAEGTSEQKERLMAALLPMKRLNLAELQAAYEGK